MKKRKIGMIAAGTALGAAYAAKKVSEKQTARKERQEDKKIQARDYGNQQVYFVGGGLASLAGAAYLIRDAHFNSEHIHIIEGMSILSGSNDGSGSMENGFVCRGGRMLNEETYENFWELFRSIPSLEMPNQSVTEEILNFDHLHPTHAQVRLVDKNGNIPGSGALMTFKGSRWLLSTFVAAQPHFKAQDANTTIFWGYGLYTDRIGDFVKKPMKECNGEEILYELICHLKWEKDWEEIKKDVINVIPCYMPYIDAQFNLVK